MTPAIFAIGFILRTYLNGQPAIQVSVPPGTTAVQIQNYPNGSVLSFACTTPVCKTLLPGGRDLLYQARACEDSVCDPTWKVEADVGCTCVTGTDFACPDPLFRHVPEGPHQIPCAPTGLVAR